jgi:hypothetical protein
VLRRARYFFSDVGYWFSRSHRRVALAVAALAVVAMAALGGYLAGGSPEDQPPSASTPQVVVTTSPESEEAEELGFPALATKNTTRVAGADPVASAAGVALAVHPSVGDVGGPDAVTLVDAEDWQGGIAAASLVAEPIGAPVLVTVDGEVPDLTSTALDVLTPEGSEDTDQTQAFRIGAAAEPDDLDSLAVEGANPAAIAAQIEQLRARLAGNPEHIVLTSADDPGFAMPAAGWAARSGDPVLFVRRDSVPAPTRRALRRHREVPVYVLGPPEAISDEVVEEVRGLSTSVERVAGEDPVQNAIAFARYADASFGWNINDPGHGLVLASVERPLDAAAAAPLSASGTWGPLLLTDEAEEIPSALRSYMLDLKPGYEDDPTRAVYNHVWLIGNPETIAVDVQAQIDDLVDLAPVSPGPGTVEDLPDDGPDVE